MNQLTWVRRLAHVGGWDAQQVARSNAASAAALLLRQRREREEVDAYLAQRLDAPADAGHAGHDGSAVGV